METIIFITLLLSLPQTKQPPEPGHVSCVMRNVEEIIVHKHDGGQETSETVDDWRVDCTVKYKGDIVWAGPLVFAHPATFREASDEVEAFRKRAGQMVQEYKRGKR